MQHKRIVEVFVIAVAFLAFDMIVFLVDLRSLREPGLLFMY